MLNWIQAGGAGQYATLFLGVLLLAAAVTHVRRGDTLQLTVALGMATLLHGVATTLEGFTQSLRLASEARGDARLTYAFLGASETITNLTVATLLVMLAALVIAFGAWRRSRAPAATPIMGSAGT